MVYQLKIGEQTFCVEIGMQRGDRLEVTVNGVPYGVQIMPAPSSAMPDRSATPRERDAVPIAPPSPRPSTDTGAGVVRAPIPGLIVAVMVKTGDRVQAGQTVAVMEAMKMENNLVSPYGGVVQEIRVDKGAEVATGDVILRIA